MQAGENEENLKPQWHIFHRFSKTILRTDASTQIKSFQTSTESYKIFRVDRFGRVIFRNAEKKLASKRLVS